MSTAGVMTITGSVNATSGNFTGKVNAGSGTIGGWTINSNGLSSSNVTISSQTNYQGIRITTASTTLNIDSSLNYIYLGKWNGDNVLHLKKDANNYFKWDANGLNISSPKLTLTPTALNISGSITTSAGLIGGWNITTKGISKSAVGTQILINDTPSLVWDYIDYGGYAFNNAHTELHTIIRTYLEDDQARGNPFGYIAGVSTGSYDGDVGKYKLGIRFSNSYTSPNGRILTTWIGSQHTSFSVASSKSVHVVIGDITGDINFRGSLFGDSLYIIAYTNSTTLSSMLLHPGGRSQNPWPGFVFSYFNTGSVTQNISLGIVQYNSAPDGSVRPGSLQACEITLSSLAVVESKGYT